MAFDPDGAAFHAFGLWNVAAEAAERSSSSGSKNPSSDALIAIAFAMIAAEAFINELSYVLCSNMPISPPSDSTWRRTGEVLISLEEDRASIRSRYLLASRLIPGGQLSLGTLPFQDFNLLIEVRNLLTHPRPSADGKAKRIITDLMRRGLIPTPPAGVIEVGVVNRIGTPEVAKWACRTVRDIVSHVVKRLDQVDDDGLFHWFRHLGPPWSEARDDPRVAAK